MKKYCESCKRRIRKREGVDLSLIDNPLISGHMHQSCFLILLYELFDEIKIDVHVISARLGIENAKKEEKKK